MSYSLWFTAVIVVDLVCADDVYYPTLPPANPSFPACNICGIGNAVTLPDADIEVPGQPAISCGLLDEAGETGFIDPDFCENSLLDAVSEICGCAVILAPVPMMTSSSTPSFYSSLEPSTPALSTIPSYDPTLMLSTTMNPSSEEPSVLLVPSNTPSGTSEPQLSPSTLAPSRKPSPPSFYPNLEPSTPALSTIPSYDPTLMLSTTANPSLEEPSVLLVPSNTPSGASELQLPPILAPSRTPSPARTSSQSPSQLPSQYVEYESLTQSPSRNPKKGSKEKSGKKKKETKSKKIVEKIYKDIFGKKKGKSKSGRGKSGSSDGKGHKDNSGSSDGKGHKDNSDSSDDKGHKDNSDSFDGNYDKKLHGTRKQDKGSSQK